MVHQIIKPDDREIREKFAVQATPRQYVITFAGKPYIAISLYEGLGLPEGFTHRVLHHLFNLLVGRVTILWDEHRQGAPLVKAKTDIAAEARLHADGIMAGMGVTYVPEQPTPTPNKKTPGQLRYEMHLMASPLYYDGTPRLRWDQLRESARTYWGKKAGE